MAATTTPPEQGQLVQVRSRQWVVNQIKASSLPATAMELPTSRSQHLLTLSSVEDDGPGEELQVVWEIEPGAKVIEKVQLPGPASLDSPAELDPYPDAVPSAFRSMRWPVNAGLDSTGLCERIPAAGTSIGPARRSTSA